MLVNPIQQTPLAYDAARQVLTPPAPAELPPQTPPATAPVQQGDTPQDKFKPRDGRGGNQQDGGTSDQEKAAIAEQLHDAWLRLQQLQEQANQALLAGDARGAKDAAEQAAEVATSIQNVTGSSPNVALGPIVVAADQLSQHDATDGSSTPGDPSDGSAPGSGGASGGPSDPGTVIDLARAGLSAASDVVDTAASIPSHPAADRISINGYKRTVQQAIAGVEAIAARVLGVATASSGGTTRIDIRA